MNQTVIVKPCAEKNFHEGNSYGVYDQNSVENFHTEMFNSGYWQANEWVTGTAQGRGTTWFVTYNSQQWVLRHYYRGGLIGKFNKDRYCFFSMQSTRAAREFALLKQLHQLQLPAPKAIAFQVKRTLCFYQADLITARIENAQDLVARLSQEELSNTLWQKIGETIRKFHLNGIYHHDLNAHNILIDQADKVWLIDFDRGEQRTVKVKWQQANMSRLLRSFRKEKVKLPTFYWQDENWHALLKGYNSL